MKISAVIIAGNEEEKIGDAIRSVDWADEVLVIDSESTDRTREIVEALGARVIVNPWPGFARQKQFGADAAVNDWIFSLDADERVTPELRDEILALAQKEETSLAAGYRIPRLAFYLGKPVRHGGWYPDWQLRFFDRRRGSWGDRVIHESWQVNEGERVEKLKNDILHYTLDHIEEHERMIRTRYAPLGAELAFQRGKRTSGLKVATAGPLAFLGTYILKGGFLDGIVGWHIARFAAKHARMKQEILLELQNGRGSLSS
ncbi:MAG: glycosyltransferase family 2 protein [Acidobacteria bacterium]|nr:glycosyltransferase family 2 protein [Acidobacteriota bacterium]